MYNHQLDTFIIVAECKSFSSAASQLYISPSAIIQQMNSLEQELNVTLFHRTKKGVELTQCGEYLYANVFDFIEKAKNIAEQLEILKQSDISIKVGTSPEYKLRFLYNLYIFYKEKQYHGNMNLSFISNAKDINNVDLIEGIRSVDAWQEHMSFLKLIDIPLKIAVSKHDRRIHKEKLEITDLKESCVLISPFIMPKDSSNLLNFFDTNQIQYEIVPSYNPTYIWEMDSKNNIILVPSIWTDTLYDVCIKDSAIEQRVEYGLFYQNQPSNITQHFINYAKHIIEDKDSKEYHAIFDELK